MLLPTGSNVEPTTPIYPGSNFTWGEATKNCTRHLQDLIIDGRLIITAIEIERKIIDAAEKLDKVRSQLGNRPLYVNSWYRPAHINSRVGGSKWSRHQYGDAVDIRSGYLSPRTIFASLAGHVGGLSRYYNFVHIDWRGKVARW